MLNGLKILLGVIGQPATMCLNFCCVAFIFFYIFTLLGMQVCVQKLGTPEERPRFHSADPCLAFTAMFMRAIGNNWNGTLINTAYASRDWVASLVSFCLLLIIGNLLLLQLFMAILAVGLCVARKSLYESYTHKGLNMQIHYQKYFAKELERFRADEER